MILFQVATWSNHNTKVNLLLLFGEHILSADIDGNLYIWGFKGIDENLEPVGHIKLDENFTPSCIMHPDTYLNKVTSFLLKKLCEIFSTKMTSNSNSLKFRWTLFALQSELNPHCDLHRLSLGVKKVLCSFGISAQRKNCMSSRDGNLRYAAVFRLLH